MKLQRRGVRLVLVLAFLAVAIPHVTYGATNFFTSPIFPAECHCDNQLSPDENAKYTITTAPDWGCVLQVLQNVINAAIELGVLLCIVWIAYGGFSLMISGGSAEARSQAKTRLLNA